MRMALLICSYRQNMMEEPYVELPEVHACMLKPIGLCSGGSHIPKPIVCFRKPHEFRFMLVKDGSAFLL